MCGIAGSLDLIPALELRRGPRGADDRRARAPRAGRRRHAGRRTPSSSVTGGSRSSTSPPPAISRWRATTAACGSPTTARSTTTRSSRRAAGARPRVPHVLRHRGPAHGLRRSGASTRCRDSTACSPSRSGIGSARSSSAPATGSASSRSTTRTPTAASASRPRSRRCSLDPAVSRSRERRAGHRLPRLRLYGPHRGDALRGDHAAPGRQLPRRVEPGAAPCPSRRAGTTPKPAQATAATHVEELRERLDDRRRTPAAQRRAGGDDALRWARLLGRDRDRDETSPGGGARAGADVLVAVHRPEDRRVAVHRAGARADRRAEPGLLRRARTTCSPTSTTSSGTWTSHSTAQPCTATG